MRDRLIDLIKQKSCRYVNCDGDCGECKNSEIFDDSIESIADHLLANGVIVPPCNVGDIVWDRKGEPHKVISIEWYSKKVMHLHCEHHTFSVGKRSIGKTVFLTKEKAEKALKGGAEL